MTAYGVECDNGHYVAPGKVRDKLSLNEPEMQKSLVEKSDLTKLKKKP